MAAAAFSKISGRTSGSPQSLQRRSGDRRAPGALARDAPVGTRRRPCRRCGCGPAGTQAVASDRPPAPSSRRVLPLPVSSSSIVMNHCSVARKKMGVCGAPAVRIAVHELLLVQQRAGGPQPLHHQGLAVEDVAAFQLGVVDRRREAPVRPHQLQQAQVVGQVEVVHAVAGGGVHQPGAGVGGDVVGQQHRRFPVEPAVPGLEALEAQALADLLGMQRHPQVLLEGLEQRRRRPRSGLRRPAPRSYSMSGCMAMARLAGRVQGVVVQMSS